MCSGRVLAPALGLGLLLLLPETAAAARISELVETDWLSQAARFFSLRDPSLRLALAGTILLGICCGFDAGGGAGVFQGAAHHEF